MTKYLFILIFLALTSLSGKAQINLVGAVPPTRILHDRF